MPQAHRAGSCCCGTESERERKGDPDGFFIDDRLYVLGWAELCVIVICVGLGAGVHSGTSWLCAECALSRVCAV